MNDFANTRAALVKYEEGILDREALFQAIVNEADFLNWQQIQNEALNEVRYAFWQDTKPYNSVSHCAIADLSFMRSCVLNADKRRTVCL